MVNRMFSKGFSLIELMIAMVIGLIATIVITQTMANFESDKLATTGTSDAQTNANIGLFSIVREVKQAGFGLMSVGEADTHDSALDCASVNLNTSGVTSINSIQVTDGTSDTITVRYGTSDFGGAVSTLHSSTTSGSPTDVKSNLGCEVGDVAIIISPTSCDLTTVTGVSTTGSPTVTFADTVGSTDNDFACIGDWNEVVYRVNNGNLERNGNPVVGDIVNIQAQYGISLSPSSNQITQWVNADASGSWNAPTLAQRKRIKAIRVAIVARNPNIEGENVTNACSSTSAANPSGLCAWEGLASGTGAITSDSPAPSIDLSADTDWQRYHYSVYESIIPLKNMIWAKGTL